MRRSLVAAGLVPVWALAPYYGSPASLWVMPIVAVLAGGLTPRRRDAILVAIASLAGLAVLWVAYGVADGLPLVPRAGSAVAIVVFHAPVVAGLAALAGWIARRVRARIAVMRAASP